MSPRETPQFARWVSASDLADYAYCPRSHYYRHHPPLDGPSEASQRAALHGTRYHRAYLGASESREAHALGWGFAALVSLLVLALITYGFVSGWWAP